MQRYPAVGVGLTLVPPWKAGIPVSRQSGKSWVCDMLSKQKAKKPAITVELHFGCLHLAT